MAIQDRKTINRYLGNRGLATLDDAGGMCAQLGFLVEDDKHFRQLLNRCEPSERRNMYEALRPHLSFEARPLDVYVSELGMEAELQQLPTLDADGKLQPYRIPEIWGEGAREDLKEQLGDLVEEGLATKHLEVTCIKCTRSEVFHGARRADVIAKVRAAGWTYGLDTKGEGHEICPDCPATRN